MSTTNKVVIGIVALGILLGVHALGWLTPVESVWVSVLDNEQTAGFRVGQRLRDTLGITNLDALRAENDQLRDERNALVIENARLTSSIETNEELKQQLQALEAREMTATAARVLGRQRSGDISTVLLDKGERDGIQTGQAVIADDGILVGTIYHVENDTSQLLLTTSSLSKLSVKLQNATTSPGVLEGERDLSANVNLIPQGEELGVGNIIVTSGAVGQVPEGIVVGTVDQISSTESELFQSVSVRLLTDVTRLSIVSIVSL